jgi:hypothetical protein
MGATADNVAQLVLPEGVNASPTNADSKANLVVDDSEQFSTASQFLLPRPGASPTGP